MGSLRLVPIIINNFNRLIIYDRLALDKLVNALRMAEPEDTGKSPSKS